MADTRSEEILKDDRFKALEDGLRQLDDHGLVRLYRHITNGHELVLDELHFDQGRGLWCPLAIGVGVPEVVEAEGTSLSAVTETRAKQLILSVGRQSISGFTLNPISGVSGEFFTRHRSRDIEKIVRILIDERGLDADRSLGEDTSLHGSSRADGFPVEACRSPS